MRKKHSFILLEVLIAMTLIATCGFAFMENSLSTLNSAIDPLVKMELQRLSDLKYAEIRTKLYQGKITWKELVDTPQGSITGHTKEEDVAISFKRLKAAQPYTASFSCEYYFEKVNGKQTRTVPNKEELRELKLHILYTPKKAGKEAKEFSHILTVQLLPTTEPAGVE